jgi:hypothetical protein
VRSKLYATYGFYKVWQRPLNKGKGFRFEVRKGNSVLGSFMSLLTAMEDAKARMNAFWDEQARVYNELKAKGEL